MALPLPEYDALDATGLGLSGFTGAMIWFAGVAGILAGGYLIYRYMSRNVRRWASVEAFFLKLPSVGPCLDALAMQRFTMCLGLTTEAGMSPTQCVKRSLRATGNRAFTRCEPAVLRELKSGGEIAPALRKCGVFTEDFIYALVVAEETGQIPESMARQNEQYREEASRRLSGLTKAASFAVWAMVAVFMVIMILRIALIYIGALSSF